jgi:hypothetical protein
MTRWVLIPMLLLAVLTQAALGCFLRHSHEPLSSRKAKDDASIAYHSHHGHHHHDGHHHGHRHVAPPAGHFHLGGESGEEHQHESSSDDTFHYVVSRMTAPPALEFAWVGHDAASLASLDEVSESLGRTEGIDAFGRSARPLAQRLSFVGAWLI